MTLGEASERFCISMEDLSYYEKNGLLMYEKFVNNVPDYTEDELRKVGIIHALLNAGMDLGTLQDYLKLLRKKAGNREEQIRILRKQRYRLLEEIHGKQQTLDEIDYMISEMKKEGIKGKQLWHFKGEAHHNMAIFYAQTDNPTLSVDVIPIGRVTSDLAVFDSLDGREEITFSLAE